MQLTSDNGPQAGESMYRLNVDAEIWGDVPKLADQCGVVPRVRRNEPPVIDGDPVRRGYFVPVERVVEPRDDRPRLRVGGRFAGEGSGVEFREGSVDVLRVKRDPCHDSLVRVDLDDAEECEVECLRLISGRDAHTTELETIAAGRKDGQRNTRRRGGDSAAHLRAGASSAVLIPGGNPPTATVDCDVVGEDRG